MSRFPFYLLQTRLTLVRVTTRVPFFLYPYIQTEGYDDNADLLPVSQYIHNKQTSCWHTLTIQQRIQRSVCLICRCTPPPPITTRAFHEGKFEFISLFRNRHVVASRLSFTCASSGESAYRVVGSRVGLRKTVISSSCSSSRRCLLVQRLR